jgi:hypothetical protein
MRKREMIRGARTSADDQPAVVPDVVAKMSKTRATEKTIHERSGFPLSGILTGENRDADQIQALDLLFRGHLVVIGTQV